jgi:probable HAF family extracellular repeat protein
MKVRTLVCTLSLAMLVAIQLAAQTTYNVVTLPGLGGAVGAGIGINNRNWITGSANFAGDTVSHATLWIRYGSVTDLGSFAGPDGNSAIGWPVKNDRGLVVGFSDTADDDPLGEFFSCWAFYALGEPTGKICKGFRWTNGQMTPLPPFAGGYSSYAAGANNRGQVVGWAENGVHDPSCDPNFQVLQFRAALWEPDGTLHELPPLPGDSTSAATAINDKGQVVGISGACGIAVGGVSAAHAVIWNNGVPTDIGNLGGHSWNTPTAINNHGTVVGFSLPAGQDGTRNYEAFVWTKDGGLHSLGKPDGDIRSAAFGVNNDDVIVGVSRTPTGTRALIWEGGVLIDLNTLTAPGSPFLLFANDINDRGEIVGEAFVSDTDQPGFVAVAELGDNLTNRSSSSVEKVTLPQNLQQQTERQAFGRLGIDPTGRQ